MRGLNDYLKCLITLHEAIEHPSLQRFLEIDTNYNPNYEYESIQPRKAHRNKNLANVPLPKSDYLLIKCRLRIIENVVDIDLEEEQYGIAEDGGLEEEKVGIESPNEQKHSIPEVKTEKSTIKYYKNTGSLHKKLAA